MVNKKKFVPQLEMYASGDYAGLAVGDLHFYYGYEVTDPETDDWCFTVKRKDKEIFRATETELTDAVDRSLNEMQDYLLVGIGLWMKQNIK